MSNSNRSSLNHALNVPDNSIPDIIRVAPMNITEKESGIKPKIKPVIRGKGMRSPLHKSTTFSPRDRVISKNGSATNHLSELSNKKQLDVNIEED